VYAFDDVTKGSMAVFDGTDSAKVSAADRLRGVLTAAGIDFEKHRYRRAERSPCS
jgi:hypothetical protein